jgi:hypothetical protein
VQQRYATRSAAFAVIHQGIWSQDNGYGCIDVKFDDNGEANALWSVGSSDIAKGKAYIRRANDH